MKDKKSKSIILASLMVTLLILGSIGSFGISVNTVKENDSIQFSNLSQKAVSNRIKINSQSVTASTIISKSDIINPLDNPPINNFENIVVTNNPGNESYPSMVVYQANALVAYEYNINNGPYIYLRKSTTYGQNWSNAAPLAQWVGNTPIYFNALSPSLCIKPNSKQAYGTFILPDGNYGVNGFFEVSDISGNINHLNVGILNWSSYGFWNFSHPDIVYHYKEGAPCIISYIGTTNYSDVTGNYAANNTLMYIFQNANSPTDYWIQWDNEIENCSNLTLDIDDASKIIYGICEIKNTTNQDLLFFSGYYDFDAQNNPVLKLSYQIFIGPENLTHPYIFVKGNHIYITAERDADGNHDIILLHSSNSGNKWSVSTITANKPPAADFSWSADRLDAVFTDNSNDVDGYITSWNWEFGDGNTSTIQNPQHNYETPGIYIVKLTVEDDDNAIDTVSKIVTIDNTTPIANFNYSPLKPAVLDIIEFSDTSIPFEDHIIINWTWDFGDGSDLVYTQNPTHQFFENKSYIMNLTIEDNTSTIDSIEKTIKVGLIADFTYEPQYPSIEDTIYFNDSSSDSEGRTIFNWTWDFGDGTSPVYLQNTFHQYTQPGIYLVNLMIRNDLNETTACIKDIIVRPSQIIPIYSRLFVNNTHISCIFIESRNLIITISSDNGISWSNPEQINNVNGSVVDQYRFVEMPDNYHILWTDNRDGNDDIYSVIKALPQIDLMIIPESVNITTEGFNFLKMNNRIKYTVKNIGETAVEDIIIEVTINRENKQPITTSYPGLIKYLAENGGVITLNRPLFRVTALEIITALINYIGIQSITVTVDPDHLLDDADLSNNAYTLQNITYGKIFPILSFLDDIL
jgi:PKD repeat protein